MKQKFGGKPPTGTPSMAWSTVVVVVSLLSGASIVHNIFKPDLVRVPIMQWNSNLHHLLYAREQVCEVVNSYEQHLTLPPIDGSDEAKIQQPGKE